jgi:hypothetical protein
MQFTILVQNNAVSVNGLSLQSIDCSTVNSSYYSVEFNSQLNIGRITNSSGLNNRTIFNDPSPFQIVINNWMTSANLSLSEAQLIKSDLVSSIFQFKKQESVALNVTAGNYTWDASNDSVEAIGLLLGATIVAGTNSTLSTVTANVVSQVDTALATLANNANTAVNTAIHQINVDLSAINAAIPGAESASYSNVATETISSPTITVNVGSLIGNVAWTPIGMSNTVQLLGSEFASLASAIASQRAEVLQAKFTLLNEISVLTGVSNVIAFDVTSGWPF